MARYEKEIEAKQRVIAQLTQANREFETLCLNGGVGDQEGELVKLRNENVELRARVEELEKENAQLQKEKDDIREVMVKMCTSQNEEWCVCST